MWFNKVKTSDEEAVEVFKLAFKNLIEASKDLKSRNINAELSYVGFTGGRQYVSGPLECRSIVRLTRNLEKF